MALEFREVTEENFDEFIGLEVKPEQADCFFFKSTKPNMMSLAQAHVYEESQILAVYDGDTMVGSVFYHPGPPPDIWLHRFMIDKRYQGKGLGRQTMLMLFERIRAENKGREIRLCLSYEPENEIGAKLYSSLGFRPTGEEMEGQVVVRVQL